MQRKEFLKRLGMASLIVPLFSGCSSEEDDLTVNTTGTSGDCTITNSEAAGPFPTKSPSTLERVDIRADRTGVDLDVEITIQNLNNNCQVLEGAIVDIWHCDKDGYYSEYGGTSMQSIDYTAVHFLRGPQITNVERKVAFTTIFPGRYQSRATHIHVHIYDSSGKSLLVTQIAFPEGNNSAVQLVNANAGSQIAGVLVLLRLE